MYSIMSFIAGINNPLLLQLSKSLHKAGNQ